MTRGTPNNFQTCYGEICNHHRNSLNKEPCHRSPDRETRRDTLDRTREEHTLSLCKYYNKLLLYLFKHVVPIISFISFHGILSLDYPYIIATSGYINWRRRRNTNSVNSFTKKKRKKKGCAVGTVFSYINKFTCIWKRRKGSLEIGKVLIFCTVSFLNISQCWQFFFMTKALKVDIFFLEQNFMYTLTWYLCI